MNIKKYYFDYNMGDAEVHFDVDLDVFTEEMAEATLDFFSWDDEPDQDKNKIDEVMKKYAMRAIKYGAFNNVSVYGIKKEFEDMEGFGKVDGSIGITLTHFAGHEFISERLDVTNK